MLIPIGIDLQHRRYPYITYVLIGLNLILFTLQQSLLNSGGIDSSSEIVRAISNLFDQAELSGTSFHWYSLITYQFIHASWWHVLGNMIFLLPFGKAVEDRMGHIGFAMFYLACGSIGGGLHAIGSPNPVIGASGSVCAVTAAFLVLAPKTNIKVLLIFFIIGVYQIPSLLFVAFFVALDTFSLLASLAGVNSAPTAWLAHLGGYLSGFAITFGLLSLRILTSTEYDLTAMFRQSTRRKAYKRVITEHQFNQAKRKFKPTPESLIAASIAQTAVAGSPLKAAELFLAEKEKNSSLKVDARTLLTLGGALMHEARIDEGVQVYEHYLSIEKNVAERSEVALLLAAKYIRSLNNQSRAKELLASLPTEFAKSHQTLIDTLRAELT